MESPNEHSSTDGSQRKKRANPSQALVLSTAPEDPPTHWQQLQGSEKTIERGEVILCSWSRVTSCSTSRAPWTNSDTQYWWCPVPYVGV
ncbi:protein arginine methyltransferase 6 [Actinidia rufa]|uniref:Protein arginine methyltransferase 6 n=1 Tax=Actinidia rufa TaxID=165716 RepID=A0A7J0DRC6_9ERIC|nr:protein arginine methyltransferase 6 [Actinidia rufa]